MVEKNKTDLQINASKNLFANLHFFSLLNTGFLASFQVSRNKTENNKVVVIVLVVFQTLPSSKYINLGLKVKSEYISGMDQMHLHLHIRVCWWYSYKFVKNINLKNVCEKFGTISGK